MSHYKYYITLEQNGWKFGLYPNNSNRQWVIISNEFTTYQETKAAMEAFQTGVALQKENAFAIQKLDIGKYQLSFIDEKIDVKYILKNHTLCQKKMERIIKNINAPLEIQEN